MSVFNISMMAAGTLAMLSAPATAERKKADADPNRIVCEKQEVLGSRLASKRVCLTVAEWKQRRAADREAIDKSQTLRNSTTSE